MSTATATAASVATAAASTAAAKAAEPAAAPRPGPAAEQAVATAGGPDSGYQAFLYDATCTANAATSGVNSGSCTFTMPATDGTYEFRLFAHDGFTRLAASNTVTLTG